MFKFENVKGFKIITLHSNFQTFFFFCNTSQKNWYWPLCIEYENNMKSHYIEEVHGIKWCTKISLDSLHNALSHHPTPHAKSPGFWSISKCQKFEPNPYFSIGPPYNDTRIHASNVSSFNRLLRSLFTQFCLQNPHSHIVVFAKPKLQLTPSRSCTFEIARVIEIWKCFLECQDWS